MVKYPARSIFIKIGKETVSICVGGLKNQSRLITFAFNGFLPASSMKTSQRSSSAFVSKNMNKYFTRVNKFVIWPDSTTKLFALRFIFITHLEKTESKN